jgi:arylformamidase
MNPPIYMSHPLFNDTPLYGGATDINISQADSIQAGATANTLNLSLPNHAGTHIDVPYHFFEDGNKLTDYGASFWIFYHPVCVDIFCGDGYLVKYDDVVNSINKDTDLLLIRTGYEQYRDEIKYWEKNPGLSAALGKELRSKQPNIRALGIDSISITSRLHREEGRAAHREFLGNHYVSEPIVLIEDMSLKNYINNISQVIILPLMISNADGAPCTIIAY